MKYLIAFMVGVWVGNLVMLLWLAYKCGKHEQSIEKITKTLDSYRAKDK